MRARGLKQYLLLAFVEGDAVAPHAGAWVETCTEKASVISVTGRAPCGRVG